jgi:uncharacterized protein (DUF983 family)
MSMLCPRCQAGNHFFRQLTDEGDWWCRFCGLTVYAHEMSPENIAEANAEAEARYQSLS